MLYNINIYLLTLLHNIIFYKSKKYLVQRIVENFIVPSKNPITKFIMDFSVI